MAKAGLAAGTQPAIKRAKLVKAAKQAKKTTLVQASMPAMFQRDCTKHQVSRFYSISPHHSSYWAGSAPHLV